MRWFALLAGGIGSVLLTLPGMGQTTATIDEQILLAARLSTADADLVEFLRQRSHRSDDAPRLKKLVEQLGSSSFKERDFADKQLLLRGPVAVPYLQAALKSNSGEVVRRAEGLIKAIESMGPEAPVAAARLLAHRQAPGALETLLGYLASAPDDWVEAEVVAALAQLGICAGKVDPRLLAALADPYPPVRGAAAFVLGRRADAEHRAAVRRLLGDPDPLVRQRAALGLVGKRWPQAIRDAAGHDGEVLKKHFGPVNEAVLLAFLRKRTLSEDDQSRLQRLIVDLGHSKYSVRSAASRLLVNEGTPALAFLKPAESARDAEVARRARLCGEEIRRGPGPALPMAVVHRLVQAPRNEQSPAEAIRTLLAYVPFADDESVEDEVINALTILSAHEVALDPVLLAALADPLPARRGAAALVLGRVGTKDHIAPVRKLLDDPAPPVRYRAAAGMLAAKDVAGVPRLIAALADVSSQQLWQVEEQLQRLAGDQGPSVAVVDGSPATRAKAVRAWDQWWRTQGGTIDLTRTGGDAFLGLVTVCEYDSAIGMPAGAVWETARGSAPRWKVTGVLGAMDGHVLPSGNVLVAENSSNRVTERDKDGNIKWEFRVPDNPVACQRLPNGNTFIASYHRVMEVDAQGKKLYDHNRGVTAFIFGAHKAGNGRIVLMTGQGTIVEIDATTGNELRTINVGANGGWCGIEALPTGRFLVATMNNNQVREIDAQGKTHWQATFPGVFRASRMPNGHTLVASMTTKKVAELDRAGQIRWEKTCEGRPWSVHWR